MTRPVIVWFRNDLRLADHPALAAAAANGPVLPLYILDDATPGHWRMGGAARWWLHGGLAALAGALKQQGGTLILRRGEAPKVLAAQLDETEAAAIHMTRGYEPWEPGLEAAVSSLCEQRGVAFRTFSGRLLFEPETIVTSDGHPYRVFTPFWKASQQLTVRAPLPARRLEPSRARRRTRRASVYAAATGLGRRLARHLAHRRGGGPCALRSFSTLLSRATPTTRPP